VKNFIYNKNLYVILTIVFIKVIFGFHLENSNPQFFFTTDSYEYIDPAKQICTNGKFNNIYNEAEIRRTPGTSFFLLPAVCFNLNLSKYIIVLNQMMILLSALFTYKVVKLMNINISAKFIFLIYLFDPTLSKHQFNILSDIIFLFCFSLTLYFLVLGIKKKNIFYLFFGYLFITVDTFVRPITLYLPYFLLIFFVLFYFFSSHFRAKLNLHLLLTILLGTILHFSITELWSYRNYKETGIKEFTYLKVQNDYLFKTAGIIAKKKNRNFIDVQEEFRKKTINLSKEEFIKLSNYEIKRAILNYPLQTIMVGLEGAIMTFFTPGTGQYPRMLGIKDNNKLSKNIFNSLGFIWIIILGLFTLYGLFKIDKEILFLLIILIFIYLIITTSGPGAYSRFRIPYMPLVIVFISRGFKDFLYLFKKNL